MPRHVIFYDTETKPIETDDGKIEQELKLGEACYYRKSYGRHLERHNWLSFTDFDPFWEMVFSHCKPKQKLWVISHNLNFDFTIMQGWKYLNEAQFKLKFFHNSGVTTIISVRSKHGSIVFIDFMNWFPESLATIGARLGIPKLHIDFETCNDFELSVYCRRDVEILLKAFKHFVGFLETNMIAPLCLTRASTSMAAFLFGSYEHTIYIHNNQEAINLERASYRGGRTECFYLGERNNEDHYLLDVNSLYPTVMYHCDYPAKYSKIVHRITTQTLSDNLKTQSAVAKVLIDTDEPAYAVRRERTIFPIGRFWVCLCTPELLYALQHNHIVKIEDCVFYDKAKLFRKFIGKFYTLRQEFKSTGMESYDILVKCLMNSLYGKFGQKAEVWEKIGDTVNEPARVETLFAYESTNTRQLRYLLNEVWELKGYEEAFNSFPAIASHVAAFARMYLYKLMGFAGIGNYLYCDTDSLIVNKRGLSNLQQFINDKNLGCLRIVKTIESLSIKGLKDYSINSTDTIKGIRKNAVKISDGVYEQERWPSLKGLLRDNIADTYSIKTQRKILRRKYTKGNLRDDGVIEPFVLYESQQPAPLLF